MEEKCSREAKNSGKVFEEAKGIFLPGKSAVPNVLAAFRLDFSYSGGQVELTVAAHTFYRIYLNGDFLGMGPAPAPFGRLKADRYDLTGRLARTGREAGEERLSRDGSPGAEIPPREIRLAVEVMGYVPREFNYSTHENSVFFGELTVDGRVVAATGQDSWRCGLLPYRDFHAEAMSHGRRYPVELYALREGYADWRTGEIPQETGFEVVAEALEETWKDGGRKEDSEISENPTGRIIQERRVAMPDMGKVPDVSLLGVFSVEPGPFDGPARNWWETDAYLACCGGTDIRRPSLDRAGGIDRAFAGILREYEDGAGTKGYEVCPKGSGSGPEAATALEFALGDAETGLIGLTLETEGPATVDIIWNDFLDETAQVPVKADSTNRIIRLESAGGRISFESMEPHFLKYIKVVVQTDKIFRLADIYVRRYRFPEALGRAQFLCSDMELNRIYEASKRTLLTNTLAFFLDSPERERGGWAGDSYWTGRAAAMLLGDTTVERSMLYDFLAADYARMLPGTFPCCCCGGEKNDPELMYTWSLFVLLELTDYYRRTGDEALKREFAARVEKFMEASRSLMNELGVLENIPGSVFIDWSASNNRANTEAVCTAANGLYAMVAQRLGEMYGVEAYGEEAARIRRVFREAYGRVKESKYDLFTMYPFLADSMTVEDGALVGNGVYSEAAQYYCFWTGLLRREDAPDLWKALVEQFGPMPERYRGTMQLSVGNCGVFFGHMMRFELLARFGETALLEREMKRLCCYMAGHDPGTFWETLGGTDSRNHGFGAHYGVVVMRDFLGMDIPDCREKILRFAPGRGSLRWAKGRIGLEGGQFTAFWHRDMEGLRLSVSAPEGYRILVELPGEFCGGKLTVNGKEEEFRRTLECGNRADVRVEAGKGLAMPG